MLKVSTASKRLNLDCYLAPFTGINDLRDEWFLQYICTGISRCSGNEHIYIGILLYNYKSNQNCQSTYALHGYTIIIVAVVTDY